MRFRPYGRSCAAVAVACLVASMLITPAASWVELRIKSTYTKLMHVECLHIKKLGPIVIKILLNYYSY